MKELTSLLSQQWFVGLIGGVIGTAVILTITVLKKANKVNPNSSLLSAFGFGHKLEIEGTYITIVKPSQGADCSDCRYLVWQVTIINHDRETRTVVRSLSLRLRTGSLRQRTLANSGVMDAKSGAALPRFSIEPLNQSPTFEVVMMVPNLPDIREAIEKETLLCVFDIERFGEPKQPVSIPMKLPSWSSLPWEWDVVPSKATTD